jgi:hypothetical protein
MKMIDKKSIHKEIDDAMHYIERMESIKLDHYFDVRVKANIRQLEKEIQSPIQPFYKKVLRPSFIAMLFIINIISVIYISGTFSTQTAPTEATVEHYIDAIAATYSIDQNNHDLVLIKTMKRTSGGGS